MVFSQLAKFTKPHLILGSLLVTLVSLSPLHAEKKRSADPAPTEEAADASKVQVTVRADRIQPSTINGITNMIGHFTCHKNIEIMGQVRARKILLTDASLGLPVQIDSNGRLGVVITPSARDMKENIAEMGSVSKKIMDLNPVTFTYKDDPTQEVQFGLMAEQVEKNFPKSGLVARDDKGKATGIKYHLLTPLLLNEVQQQQKQIQALEERLNKLEQKK